MSLYCAIIAVFIWAIDLASGCRVLVEKLDSHDVGWKIVNAKHITHSMFLYFWVKIAIYCIVLDTVGRFLYGRWCELPIIWKFKHLSKKIGIWEVL